MAAEVWGCVEVYWDAGDGWAGVGGGRVEATFRARGPLALVGTEQGTEGWVCLRRRDDGTWFVLWSHAGWYRRTVIASWNAVYGLDAQGRDQHGNLSRWRWANMRRKGEVKAVRVRAAVVEAP